MRAFKAEYRELLEALEGCYEWEDDEAKVFPPEWVVDSSKVTQALKSLYRAARPFLEHISYQIFRHRDDEIVPSTGNTPETSPTPSGASPTGRSRGMSHSDSQATSLPPTPTFIRDIVKLLSTTPAENSKRQYRENTDGASSLYSSRHLYNPEEGSSQATDQDQTADNPRFNPISSSRSSASVSTEQAFTPAETENEGRIHTISPSLGPNTQAATNMEKNNQGFPQGQGP